MVGVEELERAHLEGVVEKTSPSHLTPKKSVFVFTTEEWVQKKLSISGHIFFRARWSEKSQCFYGPRIVTTGYMYRSDARASSAKVRVSRTQGETEEEERVSYEETTSSTGTDEVTVGVGAKEAAAPMLCGLSSRPMNAIWAESPLRTRVLQ
jgi:hypothetical protein